MNSDGSRILIGMLLEVGLEAEESDEAAYPANVPVLPEAVVGYVLEASSRSV